jgi:hypothetical protein
VDVDRVRTANFDFAPLTVAVVAAYVVVCGHVTKGKVCPVNFVVHSLIYVLGFCFVGQKYTLKNKARIIVLKK